MNNNCYINSIIVLAKLLNPNLRLIFREKKNYGGKIAGISKL